MRERDPEPPEDQETSPLAASWFAAAESPVFAHRIGLRLTLGATGLVVVIILLARVAGAAVPLWLVVGIAAAVVAFTRIQERLIGEGRYQAWMPLTHMVAALVLLSIGITYTGGVQSPFVWVYALSMAVEAMLRGPAAALASATLSTVLLVTSTILVQAGVVPFSGPRWAMQTAAAFLISYIGMFYAVALVLSSMRFQIRQISRLALTDPLTGLGNRRALREHLKRELQRAARYDTQLVVVVVDLDGFKDINDRHGHLRADDLLRQLAAALQRSSRDSDFVARFGGDEFVVVLPQTSRAEAARVAERIRTNIEDVSLLEGMTLTASIGMASFPRDGTSSQELLDAADRAMYRVKGTGGNRVGAV
ncbi:MAG TPA: GGDEF domain-containing protein [bacterium]|nr:GGDEF domain-containing protein [bacterium]